MTSNLPVLLFVLPFTAALLVAALGWLIPGTARWIASYTLKRYPRSPVRA